MINKRIVWKKQYNSASIITQDGGLWCITNKQIQPKSFKVEPWQITHVIQSLPKLLPLTACNAQLLAELRAAGFLADIEAKDIKTQRNPYDKTSLLYDILQQKLNGYHGLIRALIATNQSGAAKILLQVSSIKIGSLQISLQGVVNHVSDLLSQDEIQEISSWIQNSLPMNECLEIHESIQAAETLELVRDTIPKPHTLYIPRHLSRRSAVNPKLFENPCSDVFVFKEMERPQLRKFIKSQTIASSSEQLLARKITSRFLLLDCENDWSRICANVENPVHLITYDKLTETFLLEATTGGSCALRPYLQYHGESGSQYVSEDVFLEMASNNTGRGICICDSPGMGKSFLLANIARKARERWPERLVGFIQLQKFVLQKDFLKNVTLKTLEHIATCSFASQILYKLYQRNELRLELFLDGLDEVQHENLNSTTAFLKKICNDMPTVKVYVTSRPVVRSELETAMGMIAYDIQPFNEETQRDYLTKHWAGEQPTADMKKLTEYAKYCIDGMRQTLKDNERNIAGVPLMCWLLAEVYTKKATVYADSTRKKDVKLPDHFVSSLYEIYQKFILRQLGETKCNFACIYKPDSDRGICDTGCLTYSFHVWQALKLIATKYSSKLKIPVSRFNGLLSRQILTPGVLEEEKETYVFLHRTFAEYLVAEYFAKNNLWELDGLRATSYLNPQITYSGLNEIFMIYERVTLECRPHILCQHCLFFENVVAYFLDAMISQKCEKLTLYKAKISPFNKTFLNWVRGCLDGNLHGLLNLLLQTAGNYKSESQVWTNLVNHKLLCFWKPFNKHIANVLHMAAVHCDINTIENLFQFFVKVVSPYLMTILQHNNSFRLVLEGAMIRGDYERVRYLVERFPFTLNKDVFENWLIDIKNKWKSEEMNEGNEKNAQHGNHMGILDLIFTHKSSLLEETYLRLPFIFHLVKCKNLEIIKFLASREVSIFAVDRIWGTILHMAAYGKDEDFFCEIVRVLGRKWINGQANASLSCSGSNQGPKNVKQPEKLEHYFNWPGTLSLQTPIHYAVYYFKDMKLETLDLLLAGGIESKVEAQQFTSVNINAVDKYGWTALHKAFKYQRLKLVKHLIARGADWNLKTKYGCNAVHICAYSGSEQHLKYFLELGCNVNELDLDGNNALQCSLHQRWTESDEWNKFGLSKAKILIDAGVNITNKNLKGKTARQLAVLNGWPEEIVKLL